MLSADDLLIGLYDGGGTLRYNEAADVPAPGAVAPGDNGLTLRFRAWPSRRTERSTSAASNTDEVYHYSNSGAFLGVLGENDADPGAARRPWHLGLRSRWQSCTSPTWARRDLSVQRQFRHSAIPVWRTRSRSPTTITPGEVPVPGGFTFATNGDLIVGRSQRRVGGRIITTAACTGYLHRSIHGRRHQRLRRHERSFPQSCVDPGRKQRQPADCRHRISTARTSHHQMVAVQRRDPNHEPSSSISPLRWDQRPRRRTGNYASPSRCCWIRMAICWSASRPITTATAPSSNTTSIPVFTSARSSPASPRRPAWPTFLRSSRTCWSATTTTAACCGTTIRRTGTRRSGRCRRPATPTWRRCRELRSPRTEHITSAASVTDQVLHYSSTGRLLGALGDERSDPGAARGARHIGLRSRWQLVRRRPGDRRDLSIQRQFPHAAISASGTIALARRDSSSARCRFPADSRLPPTAI